MSLFGECTLKNLTAEYVEEKMALEAADVSTSEGEVSIPESNIDEVADISTCDETDVTDLNIEESADFELEESYIDNLLEALD